MLFCEDKITYVNCSVLGAGMVRYVRESLLSMSTDVKVEKVSKHTHIMTRRQMLGTEYCVPLKFMLKS